jgi:hypothetical protein
VTAEDNWAADGLDLNAFDTASSGNSYSSVRSEYLQTGVWKRLRLAAALYAVSPPLPGLNLRTWHPQPTRGAVTPPNLRFDHICLCWIVLACHTSRSMVLTHMLVLNCARQPLLVHIGVSQCTSLQLSTCRLQSVRKRHLCAQCNDLKLCRMSLSNSPSAADPMFLLFLWRVVLCSEAPVLPGAYLLHCC